MSSQKTSAGLAGSDEPGPFVRPGADWREIVVRVKVYQWDGVVEPPGTRIITLNPGTRTARSVLVVPTGVSTSVHLEVGDAVVLAPWGGYQITTEQYLDLVEPSPDPAQE